MSLETMTKLASTTVGSGGSASITFSNIPQGYTDLSIKLSSRTARAADEDGLGVQLNSSTAGYTYIVLTADGSTAGSINTPYGQLWTCRIQGNSPTAGIFSSTDLYFPNYSGNTAKVISADSVTEKTGTNGYTTLSSVIQSNSSPITSITLSGLNASFLQYTKATLYGVKNAAKTAGNSIKATGGNIVFDGTYVYHVFNTTGAFTPSQALRADYLVIAGGGGGGSVTSFSTDGAPGGGAGGLRSTVTATGGGGSVEQPLSLSAGASYTVTVGAGGNGGASDAAGTSGSDSAFSTIISTGGGGGGGFSSGTGKTGGSGGGASYDSTFRLGGAGTPGQGYAGGDAANPSGAGGGGGGAGGAGQVGQSGSNGANGGVGVSIPSIATATGTGVNGYYAGGGGGGSDASSGSAGAGGAGGGGTGFLATATAATAGTAYTGSGGGGGGAPDSYSTGGNGGSGIVIVRYKG